MAEVIKLIPNEQIHSILPLVQTLNPALSYPTLTRLLDEMISQGYRCAGLYKDGELIGICGLWIMTKFYAGKHIEPDNVIIAPQFRGQGYGKKLLAWVYEYGKLQGCCGSELNCYISNLGGQAFWEQEGYIKIGYHYQRPLE